MDLDELTIDAAQARMASGELSARQLVEAYLERIEAIDRAWTDAAQRARDQPGRARDCRRPRPRARRGTRARPAARHARSGQRQHRHGGSHADHRRLAGAAGRESRGRRARRRPAARGRRGGPGQGQPERVGQLPLDALLEWLERPRATDAQSVRARSQSGRFELRARAWRCRPTCASPRWAARPTARS